MRRPIAVEVPDSPNGPVEIDVEQIACRTDLQLHGTGGRGPERRNARRIRIDARAVREHHPDAVPRVVGEEQRALIRLRVVAAVVKRQTRDRGAAGRTLFPRHNLVAVVIRKERIEGRACLVVQVLAQVQVHGFIAWLASDPFVAGPSEVPHGRDGRVVDAIDLFPRIPADVADKQLPRAGPEGKPERIAETVRDDAARVDVRARGQRIVGRARARIRIDADDRAVQVHRIRERPQILTSKRPSLRGGRRQVRSSGRRRVAKRIAELAVVDVVETGALAAAHIQVPIDAKRDRADRVAWELVCPVFDQYQLRSALHVPRCRQTREPPADDAPVLRQPASQVARRAPHIEDRPAGTHAYRSAGYSRWTSASHTAESI